MRSLLLGIDIGTSACKCAAFLPDGTPVAQATEGYPVFYPNKGWAEQDADDWWNAVCRAIKTLLESGISANEICCIGIDGQSWSAIAVDGDGNPLCRTPIWMDTRADDICKRIRERIGEEKLFAICGNPLQPSYTTPKVLWYKEQRPEIYEKTDKILQSNGYIAYRLTGEMSQDVSQGYGWSCFDMQKLTWDIPVCRELGIREDLLPQITRCDQVIGTVTAEAAAATGLLPGTPVVAGGLDAACGTLGAGVYKPGQTQEQGGQAGGMSICMDRPFAHEKLILSPHVVPGQWLLQGGTVGGGGVLRWYRQEFAADQSFGELTEGAEKIAPGSGGVIFLPYMAGERSPIWNPDAKGVFYGLSYDKTRDHMVRAMLEGVAYSLEHNLRIAASVGAEVGTLNAMGGASNSLLWTQIKADVTGKKFQVPASDTATTLGAALLAGVGCGLYSGYEEAVSKTVQIRRVHEPNLQAHEIYKKYMEQYLQLSGCLSSLFGAN